MQRIILSILLISILALSGLGYWHASERRELEQQFINKQVETIFKPKQQQLEKVFNSLYQNIRTISLLPSVRKIQGDNRHDEHEDIVATGRFTEEGQETVQQIYNNLAVNVSVSEIYAVLDGLDANQGQIPFFMFDTLKFGEKVVEEEAAPNPDFPEESETAEYSYFPTQMQNLKSAYGHFDFKHMEDIPAFISPMMRTCDNTQYLSKATGNEQETFGILYSVPFYTQKTGNFKGVISAIIRANAFEAALMNVPFIPITEQDKAQQLKSAWQLPETSRFMLSNANYGIHINDRRNTTLAQDLLHGVAERNVFRVQLNVHSDAPWELSYYLPESMIQEALAASDQAFYVLVAVVMGVLLIAVFAVILVTRMRTKLGGNPETVAQVVNAVSQGNLAISIPSDVGAESVLGSMHRMLKQLQLSAEQALENQRIRQALDNVTTCVMISNSEHRIIYINPALQQLFEQASSDFSELLSEFNATQLLGTRMDALHPDPAKLSKVIEDLHAYFDDNIVIGKYHFHLSLNPIFNAESQRLGTVAVWTDRTAAISAEHAEFAIKSEVAELIQAASAGDYSHRIETAQQTGFFKTLSEGMNQLLDNNAQALEEVGNVLEAMAHGDLTQRMTKSYTGALGKLKADSNTTVEYLTHVINQLNTISQKIDSAAQAIAEENENLSLRTERQAANVEQTAASMEELTTTVQQNADNAIEASQMAISAANVAEQGGRGCTSGRSRSWICGGGD